MVLRPPTLPTHPPTHLLIHIGLGADIILTLDECTPFHVEKKYTEESMARSHRWEMRSLMEFIRGDDGTQVCLFLSLPSTHPPAHPLDLKLIPLPFSRLYTV